MSVALLEFFFLVAYFASLVLVVEGSLGSRKEKQRMDGERVLMVAFQHG